jgi:hypothetical protein
MSLIISIVISIISMTLFSCILVLVGQEGTLLQFVFIGLTVYIGKYSYSRLIDHYFRKQ